MPIDFTPRYTISAATASALMQIEAVRTDIEGLPITPSVLANLRETARLYSTHYSTMIEGNQLQVEDVAKVIDGSGHFAGRERDEKEVKGYYNAMPRLWRMGGKLKPQRRIATGKTSLKIAPLAASSICHRKAQMYRALWQG